MSYMVAKGGSSQKNNMTLKIVSKIMNEAIEDMREADLHPDIAAMYLRQLGTMVNWVADGTWNADVPKPEDFNG